MKISKPKKRDPARQKLMSTKSMLSRLLRVREQRIEKMDAAIAEQRERVAIAERDYVTVKKVQAKPKTKKR